MAMPDWFADWIDAHRRAFLLPETWIDAAVEWWPQFAARFATEGLMLDATHEVMAGQPPKYLGDHLPAVAAALGRVRDRAEADRRQADDDARAAGRSVCADCGPDGDRGWVLVPHEGYVDGAAWKPKRHTPAGDPEHVTYAVACRCPRGRKVADDCRALKYPCLTLDRYEARVTQFWRDMLAEVRAAEAARREARVAPRPDDGQPAPDLALALKTGLATRTRI